MNQDYITDLEERWGKFHKDLYLPGSAINTRTIAEWWEQELLSQRNLLIEDFKKCVPSRIDPKLDNIIKEEVAGFNICRNQILDNIEKL